MASQDPKRVLATVCCPALQFNTAKKQFVATRKVPEPVSRRLGKQSFAGDKEIEKRSLLPTTQWLSAVRLQCSVNRLSPVPASGQASFLILTTGQPPFMAVALEPKVTN